MSTQEQQRRAEILSSLSDAAHDTERIGRMVNRVLELESAVQLALRWQYDRDNVIEQYEDIGEWFYKETGMLRPGKDDARGIHMDKERSVTFAEWCANKGGHVRSVLEAALSPQSEGTPGQKK